MDALCSQPSKSTESKECLIGIGGGALPDDAPAAGDRCWPGIPGCVLTEPPPAEELPHESAPEVSGGLSPAHNRSTTSASCSPAPNFYELLRQLEAAHAHEVTGLQGEVLRLRGLAPGPRREGGPDAQVFEEGPGHASPRHGRRAPPQDGHKRACRRDKKQPPVGREASGSAWTVEAEVAPGREAVRLMRVTIIGAKGLRSSDWAWGSSSSHPDPYCVCEIPNKPRSRIETKVIENTTEPEWDHEAVVADYSSGDALKFIVNDRDWLTSDDVLGTATLSSADFHPDGFTGWLPLSDGEKRDAYLNVRVEIVIKSNTLQVLPVWNEDRSRKARAGSIAHRAKVFLQTSLEKKAELRSGVTMNNLLAWRVRQFAKDGFLFHPDTLARVMWDFFGIFCLALDLVWIPMQVFDPPDSALVGAIMWTTLLYWTLDICVTFNTGVYLRQGRLVTQRRQICMRYLRGMFCVDALLMAVEWGMLARQWATDRGSGGADSVGVARAGKLVRAGRVIRLFRLMRLAKLRQLLFTLQTLIDSEWMTIVFIVTRNMLTIFALQHVLACAWFYVGSAGSGGWVSAGGYGDIDTGQQYLVSLQWCMAQFTPGASPVSPRTTGERVFAVSVLGLGFVVATCFISTITSTLAAVWSMRRYESTQAFLLKKFLKQNHISRVLGARITKYIDCVLHIRHRKVHPSKVDHLRLLSGPLHVALQSELLEPQLTVHPLFVQFKFVSNSAMRELCTTALAQVPFAKHDVLFCHGLEARHMYILTIGTLVYRFRRVDKTKKVVKLDTGNWCCENALWTRWTHFGDMKALTDVDVTMLSAAKFCEVACMSRDSHELMRQYALHFVEGCQRAMSFDPCAVTDITPELMKGSAPVDEALRDAASELSRAEDMQAEIVGFSDCSDSDDEDPEPRGG